MHVLHSENGDFRLNLEPVGRDVRFLHYEAYRIEACTDAYVSPRPLRYGPVARRTVPRQWAATGLVVAQALLGPLFAVATSVRGSQSKSFVSGTGGVASGLWKRLSTGEIISIPPGGALG